MYLYIDYLSQGITTLGPGRRIVLWVQGCSIRCPACMSSELFSCSEDNLIAARNLFEVILSNSANHTGLTISGGEPFEQAEALSSLLTLVHNQTSLDIMVYTGYTLSEIENGSKKMQKLLSLVDILVDGPFRLELPTEKLWCGSDNQVIYLLTPRVRKYKNSINKINKESSKLQIEIAEDKSVRIIGIPRRGELQELKQNLEKRGIKLVK